MENSRNSAIRMSYFARIPNVGDSINPYIVTTITGRQTINTTETTKPYLLAIGSLMAASTPNSEIWGTGVMHPDLGVGGALASNIHALRGTLSHSALVDAGVRPRDVPLGDPAFLAPQLLGIQRAVSPTHRVGLVPHYVDRRNPIFKKLLSQYGAHDLSVHLDPKVFLQEMAHCEVIISSSLHGLIFSEALGLPSLWVKASDEIAGRDFKFHDWFTTTARPQKSPHVLSSEDNIDDLALRAEPRESIIEPESLCAAFPHERMEILSDSGRHHLVPFTICRTRPLPVFLISFNRGHMLQKSINSIRGLSRPTEIIIHDNGSNDPSTLSILADLEKSGIRVYRHAPIFHADELNNVNDTIADFFNEWGELSRYVVSDCDIDVCIADPRILDVYDELLNIFRHAESVGPMLRISDIPTNYPLYNRVMNRHIEQFWSRHPSWVETSYGRVAYLESPIDTTFALHRAGEPFRRMKNSLRVYEPYEALHLDWYHTKADSKIYAESSSSEISHWDNTVERDRYRNVNLEHTNYYVVKKYKSDDGISDGDNLVEVEIKLNDTPTKHETFTDMSIAFIIRFHYDEDDTHFLWRFSYFQSMVLPRILRQTHQNFDIAIWCNPWHEEKFLSLSNKIKVFRVKPEVDGYIRPEDMAKAEKYHVDFTHWHDVVGLDKYDLQIGLDSDDLISENYVLRILNEIGDNTEDTMHISFQPMMFNLKDLTHYDCVSSVKYSDSRGSPFFAIFQKNSSQYLFAYEYSHFVLPGLFKRRSFIDDEYCCFTIHDYNASTRLPASAIPIGPISKDGS